ncbi:MAG TPA: hypothetical protein VM140_02560 [Burkholderiales bacterium]|nr:hypothetical protein [Burkholderiales bacterium]
MDLFAETQGLIQRFRQGAKFRLHVRDRLRLIVPALVVFLLFSVATTAGSVIAIGGTHRLLVLLAMLLAPVILIGSLFVQLYVFFTWVEARSLGHPPEPKTFLVALPVVLRVLAGVFLVVPVLLLTAVSFKAAVTLLLLLLLTPVAYNALDR